MTEKLQTLIDSARELSFLEKLELLNAVSELLRSTYHQPASNSTSFWQSKTIDQLIQEQQTQPVMDIQDLAVDFWPEDEAIDEFLDYIYQQRLEDKTRE